MMNDWERRARIAFAIAIAVATAARIFLVNSIADRSYFAKYVEFADALRAGTIARDRIPDLSPGYLWTVALLRTLGLGVPEIRALQIIVLSGVAIIAASIAYRYRGNLAALAAALLILGSKAALVNATDLEPETLLLFFSALGLLFVVESRAFLAGLMFGIAATFRPVVLLAALAMLIPLWRGRRRQLPRFAIAFAIPILTVLLINRAMTGSMLLMDPGTVFYEGMNPNATGYAGVAPRIVKDIEQTIPGSDTMHVAYRIVAARAIGRAVTREEANRFWSQKAFAFMREYPARAASLVLRKARLLVSTHDAYDVPSMVLKDRALRGLWIPWSLLVALALFGAATRRLGDPAILYLLCAAVSPIAFFVTARHRNPLLIGLAILGGIGVATLIERRAVVASVIIVLAAIAFSIPGDLQGEDDYLWTATFEVSRAMTVNDRATAATWLPESVPLPPADVLRTTALRHLKATTSPARSFSIAVALILAGDAATADQILERLQSLDYHSFRRTRAVSSVAYYRARALLLLNRTSDARRQIARARRDAPGDADVLALAAFLERNAAFARQLDRLHDPFTRDWSLARAAFAIGDVATARRLAVRAASGCPEWPLPRDTIQP